MSEEKKYIEASTAEKFLRDLADDKLLRTGAEYANGIVYAACHIKDAPAANVRPMEAVDAAADEAIRILNAIQSAGRLEYGDYCELHDAISEICGHHEETEART